MGRPRVIHACADCGKPTPRRGRVVDGVRCAPCAVNRYEESARQILAGEGPFYEKWLEGMASAVERQRARIAGGTSTQDTDTAP